jgi:uncharacterized protein (DUF362 family)
MSTTRRDFIKLIFCGSAGLAIGFPARQIGRSIKPLPSSPSTVYFRTGSDRHQLIYDTLLPLEDTVRSTLGNRQIIIKPNFVVSGKPQCATHVEAVRGILDFLKRITDQQIIIAESPASGDAMRCFDQYGYKPLEKEYNVQLVDLNTEPTIEIGSIMQSDGSSTRVRLIKTLLEKKNYVISVSLPKTHDTVVATLTTKNIIMASPLRPGRREMSDKVKMHGGQILPQYSEYLTKNMFLIAPLLLPDLAVLDGFEGMEGNGPVRGSAVHHRVAVVGTDSIAVDAIGLKLMGIEPRYLRYLKWCGDAGLGNFDEKQINVVGADVSKSVKKYKLHDTF